jgi:hypothetical protein
VVLLSALGSRIRLTKVYASGMPDPFRSIKAKQLIVQQSVLIEAVLEKPKPAFMLERR